MRTAIADVQKAGATARAEREDEDAARGGDGARGLQEGTVVHVPGEGLDPVEQVDAC